MQYLHYYDTLYVKKYSKWKETIPVQVNTLHWLNILNNNDTLLNLVTNNCHYSNLIYKHILLIIQIFWKYFLEDE